MSTAFTKVTGSVALTTAPQLQVSNFPATQNVSGTVNAAAYIQNWPAVMGVSGSLSVVPVYTNTPQGISGTVQVWSEGPLPVSGNVGAFVQNWPATIGVSASIPLQVWSEGSFGVTGSVSITSLPQVQVSNFPATQNVSGSVSLNPGAPIQVWSEGAVGVSGSVSVLSLPQVSVNNFPATQNVSGTVTANVTFPAIQQVWIEGTQGISGTVSISNSELSVDNFPAVQAVSGSQLSGSTFSGFPLVVGGVYASSGNAGNLPQYVVGLKADVSGALYVTTTGSLPVAVVGTVPVSVGGTVNVSQQGQISVNNFPATQNISGTVTANVTFPAIQQVWIEGTQGISGSVSILSAPQLQVSNFPATQAVSGTVTVQGAGAGLAAPVQIWSEGLLGVSGSLSVTPVYTNTPQGVSGTVQVWGAVTVVSASQLQVSNFPATQNVSGTVTANIGTAPQLQISNFPAVQAVSGTLTVTGSVGVTNLYQGLPAIGTGIAQSAPANQVDTFPWTLSLTGSLSASNGQVLPLKSDYQGNLANREQFAPVAEDNFNGVIAVTKLPTIASIYTWALAGTLTGLASASQIKASAGVLRSLSGRIDASAPASTYFLQITNTVTGVAAGVAQPNLVPPVQLVHGTNSSTVFSIDFTSEGVFFSAGCQVALSTATEFTYTAAGNVMSVGAEYK